MKSEQKVEHCRTDGTLARWHLGGTRGAITFDHEHDHVLYVKSASAEYQVTKAVR